MPVFVKLFNNLKVKFTFINCGSFAKVCHFDEGEILARSSTKIGLSLRSYLRGFLLRRNDKIVCVKNARFQPRHNA